MPYPIRKTKEQFEEPTIAVDNLSQFISQPYSLLQSLVYSEKDKNIIKTIWASSQIQDDKSMIVGESIPGRELYELVNRGLINFIDQDKRIVALTDRGAKMLRETLLNEKSSFTKQASKQLVSKNSYDFGDEILIRVSHPEKFGTRFMSFKKKTFASKAKPQIIEEYKIATRKNNGEFKEIQDYTEEELVHVLHLAKKIIDNAHGIVTSEMIEVPVHRIKAFAEIILEKMNKI